MSASLADFIGQLTSAITRARLQADLEAVRVAEIYASHPHLRHFPVPRFRLPDVEITAPVVITEVEGPNLAGVAADKLKREDIESVTEAELGRFLKRKNINLGDDQRSSIIERARRRISEIDRTDEVAADVGSMSRAISRSLMADLIDIVGEDKLKDWRRELEMSLRVGLLNKRPNPPSVKVLAETAQLKAASAEGLLVNLKLKISEDGMEWTMIDRDGEVSEQLIPE